MTLLIGFLTLAMVMNCLLLILLVLVQLPKKEAGAGLAFGGGASDALFGAGSGTALSNITKYASVGFLGLAMLLTVLNTRAHRSSLDDINKALREKTSSSAPAAPAASAPALGSGNPLLTPAATPAPAATPSATPDTGAVQLSAPAQAPAAVETPAPAATPTPATPKPE